MGYQRKQTEVQLRSVPGDPPILRVGAGIGGQDGTFSEWIRAAYEINEDFDQSFAEIVSGLCGAFHDADAQYGRDISRQLYNTLAVVLPTEIQSAAQYLSLGGSLDHVLALALVGFLMEPQNHDSMLRAVKHMNDGGDVASAYYAAEGKCSKTTLLSVSRPCDTPNLFPSYPAPESMLIWN